MFEAIDYTLDVYLVFQEIKRHHLGCLDENSLRLLEKRKDREDGAGQH